MRLLEYFLLPESGYSGEYERSEAHYKIKNGTVADMIHDSGMLWGYDFDKVIPSLERLNNILMQGYFARLVEWEPFYLELHEYDEMVQQLLVIPMDQPYRLK